MNIELNPFSYQFHENPYPIYKALRDSTPVYRNDELRFWALSRYQDVFDASLDYGTYSSAEGTTLEMSKEAAQALPIIIFMDPPRQVRLRKLVSKAFTPKTIESLEPRIRALAVELLEPLSKQGSCDFVKDYAALLPIEVISEMLGVPPGERTQIREWTDAVLHREPNNPKPPKSALIAHASLHQYFTGLLARRKHDLRDDMLSLLIQAEVANDQGELERLTDLEIVAFMSLLASAGNETVTKLLGNAAVLLARHPESRQRLTNDVALVPNAVEEILRYYPPSQYQGRTLTHDVELHGVKMPKGDKVLLLTGSACRDEREYPDADRFDISRKIPIALAFGHGVHKCLGAALARLESRVSLETLHHLIPEYRIDESRCERVHMSNVHGFASVPMTY